MEDQESRDGEECDGDRMRWRMTVCDDGRHCRKGILDEGSIFPKLEHVPRFTLESNMNACDYYAYGGFVAPSSRSLQCLAHHSMQLRHVCAHMMSE